jgi:hypothetical protein
VSLQAATAGEQQTVSTASIPLYQMLVCCLGADTMIISSRVQQSDGFYSAATASVPAAGTHLATLSLPLGPLQALLGRPIASFGMQEPVCATADPTVR